MVSYISKNDAAASHAYSLSHSLTDSVSESDSGLMYQSHAETESDTATG